MKTHIDFFPAVLSEHMKKRFTIKDNLTSIPDRHKPRFSDGIVRHRWKPNDGFMIIAFYQEDKPEQVFKYITQEQFHSFRKDINWCDNQTRTL